VLALGYRPMRIVLSYLVSMSALALIGIGLGTLEPSDSATPSSPTSKRRMDWLTTETHAYPSVLAAGAAYVLLVTALSTVAACRELWNATPVSLMRTPPATSDARIVPRIKRLGRPGPLRFAWVFGTSFATPD